VFISLAAVYISEFFAVLDISFAGEALGFLHLGTAGWLLSLTWAVALNFVAGYHLMVQLLPRQGAGPGLNAPVLDSSDTKR
jgi:hypothetical protein